MQEPLAGSLGREDPLEEGMATHSRILAWESPCIKEPGGLQFMGLQRVGHDSAAKHRAAPNANLRGSGSARTTQRHKRLWRHPVEAAHQTLRRCLRPGPPPPNAIATGQSAQGRQMFQSQVISVTNPDFLCNLFSSFFIYLGI